MALLFQLAYHPPVEVAIETGHHPADNPAYGASRMTEVLRYHCHLSYLQPATVFDIATERPERPAAAKAWPLVFAVKDAQPSQATLWRHPAIRRADL